MRYNLDTREYIFDFFHFEEKTFRFYIRPHDLLAFYRFKEILDTINSKNKCIFNTTEYIMMMKILDSVKRFFEKNSSCDILFVFRRLPEDLTGVRNALLKNFHAILTDSGWLCYEEIDIDYVRSHDFFFLVLLDQNGVINLRLIRSEWMENKPLLTK